MFLVWIIRPTLCKDGRVRCEPVMISQFFNPDEPKARQSFNTSHFNVSVNEETFGPRANITKFFYAQKWFSDSNTDFYDLIILEKTAGKTIEHNFQNFLNDSLFSYLHSQEFIQKDPPAIQREQRLLFISIAI